MANVNPRASSLKRQMVWRVLALLLLAGCGPTPVVTRAPVTLELAVSSACAPLLNDLTAAWHAARPHVTFKLRQVNSAQAMEALWASQVDLAAVSWLTNTETLWTTPVALDGIAIIVHPSNPVNQLALLQLRDVFRGRAAEWPDVGGLNGEIVVTSRESGSGTRAKFEEAVMGGRNVTINAVALASERAVVQYVASITTSIGYVSSSYLTSTIQALSVEGVPLTPATLADKRYPMLRPLFFVTPEEPQGELRAFVAWVLGPEGQTLVGKKYARVQ